MKLSSLCIERPVATTLLTLGVALAGAAAFFLLPVSPLPQVDYPTISVQASMPGASPETMATAVATPLERHLGSIADVQEMTSSSSVGSSRVTLQFGLDRDIDGAARDVQAAINAARADLPATLRSNPTYRKVNPADSPVLILAMTSPTLTQGQVYDSAATVLQQKLSQVQGIGQVSIGGSSLPAVRVELNPRALFAYGIGLEDIRAALAATNANSPKGAIEDGDLRYQIYTNDQARKAEEFANLVVAYRNGNAVRLSDLAEVSDSVEDLRNQGLANGSPAVLLQLFRQPNANIIDTVGRVKALLPRLQASIPSGIDLAVVMDRTTTIRSSLHDVERTLLLAVGLVIGVVYLFLRDGRATLIPATVVPVSLIGTFAVMWLLGFSLDNLSLMALIIATGFVVDDAVVVLENTMRHVEAGMPPRRAALLGAREVGFTVLSMSVSLVAVFLPILLMGGYVGRMFREFALTLSVAIAISLMISLTTTPMMCARLLRRPSAGRRALPLRLADGMVAWLLGLYRRTLAVALEHRALTLLTLVATVAVNWYLLAVIPKGFFPAQDTGRLIGGIQADQTISFQLMRQKLASFIDLVKADPAVDTVVGFTGGGQTNSGFVFISLKPLAERRLSADAVIARMRPKLGQVQGAAMFLQAASDIRAGGRQSNATYQYTLQADDLDELRAWTPKLTDALKGVPELADVNSDQQEGGLETDLTIDREMAARLHLTASQIDSTLYDAFGQRQVSTIFNPLNQYHVVMEVAPRFWQSPETLRDVFVSTSGGAVSGTQSTNAVAGTNGAPAKGVSAATVAGDSARNLSMNQLANTTRGSASTGAAVSASAEKMVPFPAVTGEHPGRAPLSVNHQGHFVASTVSFNLPVGTSISEAVAAIEDTMHQIGVPATIHGSFQGTARAAQQSIQSQPLMILAALIAVYLVLGILYESYVHPLTILSTLPSAGVGAVLALIFFGTEFSLIALIGVILLIGIVKKNAIMMVDVALELERTGGLAPREAIFAACLLRFRPIMMTTMVALLASLPLALGGGEGAELRRPLGIAIVGGLAMSQVLTLYTTPVVYLSLERLRQATLRRWSRGAPLPITPGGGHA